MEHEKLTKSMEICDKSCNFTNFAPKFYQICIFFVIAKKNEQKSRKSPTFSTNCRDCKIWKRDGHGKSRNVHGKVMEKYFFKYVGTL